MNLRQKTLNGQPYVTVPLTRGRLEELGGAEAVEESLEGFDAIVARDCSTGACFVAIPDKPGVETILGATIVRLREKR